MGLADLHLHTDHSFDSTAPVAAVLGQSGWPGCDCDAHFLKAIGLGATEFPGHTSKDLLAALCNGSTVPRKARHGTLSKSLAVRR
jgi:hypothetical protein